MSFFQALSDSFNVCGGCVSNRKALKNSAVDYLNYIPGVKIDTEDTEDAKAKREKSEALVKLLDAAIRHREGLLRESGKTYKPPATIAGVDVEPILQAADFNRALILGEFLQWGGDAYDNRHIDSFLTGPARRALPASHETCVCDRRP